MLQFDHTGDFLSSWGRSPALTSPHGAEAALLGTTPVLWVADIEDFTVKAFTASGTLLGVIGTPGKGGNGNGTGVQFSAPADIAVDPVTGALYVSDGDGGSNNRVTGGMVAGNAYAPAFVVGGAGSGTGQFSSPHSIAWDPVNSLAWVADRGNNRTVALAGLGHPSAAPGTWMGAWDMTSCAQGGQPWGIRVDAPRGTVAVVDGLHGMLYILALPSGTVGQPGACQLVQAIPVCPAGDPKAGCTPHELAVDRSSGELYVAAVGTTGGPTEILRYTPAS